MRVSWWLCWWCCPWQKELHDRASDPACANELQKLSSRLFDGWDPVAITARAAERKDEAQLLGKWQGSVKPEQTHVWRIEPYGTMTRHAEPDVIIMPSPV